MSCFDFLLQKAELTNSPSCYPLEIPRLYQGHPFPGLLSAKDEHGDDTNSCPFLKDLGLLGWVTLY